MEKCLVVMADDLLKVLLDLPPDMEIDRLTTQTVHSSDGVARKLHLLHFEFDPTAHPDWPSESQLDFQYTIDRDTGATALHSIRYSSQRAARTEPRTETGRLGTGGS